MTPFEIAKPTMADIIHYVDEHMAQDPIDHKTAYAIVALLSIPAVEALRDNSDLNAVLEIAGGLEIPGRRSAAREVKWTELRRALERLRATA